MSSNRTRKNSPTRSHNNSRKPRLNTIYESFEPLFSDYKQKRTTLFELSKQVDDLEDSETNRDIKKIHLLDMDRKELLKELINLSNELIKQVPEELHNSKEYSMLLGERDNFHKEKLLINTKMYNGGKRFRKTIRNKKINRNRKTIRRNRKTKSKSRR